MPVRSLNSSVLKWPDRETVHRAVVRWADDQMRRSPSLLQVGYVGSYARGDWGVGSDVDLILIVDDSELPFWRRAIEWDTADLPVPADVLVYTLAEWNRLADHDSHFYRVVRRDAVWVRGDASATAQG